MNTTRTTPATRWVHYVSFPVVFTDRYPKAIMLNDAGNVVLLDRSGNSVTFTPAIGIPIQLRPSEIVSTTAPGGVIGLFD
jgi:hypothetical protein